MPLPQGVDKCRKVTGEPGTVVERSAEVVAKCALPALNKPELP